MKNYNLLIITIGATILAVLLGCVVFVLAVLASETVEVQPGERVKLVVGQPICPTHDKLLTAYSAATDLTWHWDIKPGPTSCWVIAKEELAILVHRYPSPISFMRVVKVKAHIKVDDMEAYALTDGYTLEIDGINNLTAFAAAK